MSQPAIRTSRRPLPQAELNGHQMAASFRCMIASSILAVVAGQIFAGSVLTLLAWSLGAKEGYIGLLNMLVFCSALAQFVVVPLAQRTPKREVIIICFLSAFVFSLPVIGLHWIKTSWGLTAALAVLAICVTGRQASVQSALPSWLGLLREVTAPEQRGRLLGKLRTIWQVSVVALLIAVGLYLGQNPSWQKLQVVVIIGALAQMFRALVLVPVTNPPVRANRTTNTHRMLLVPLRDRTYLPFILYCGSYGLALGLAESFRIVYMLRLGFSERISLIAASMISLGAASMLMFWGKLADRYGNRSVFGLTHVGMILTTVVWLLVQRPQASARLSDGWSVLILPLVLFWAGGAFNGGNGIAQTRYMFSSLKPEAEAAYVAVCRVLLLGSIGLGALFGGQLLAVTEPLQDRLGPAGHYKLLFATSAALFLIPLWIRRRFQDTGETPARHVLTAMTQPLRVVVGAILAWPYREDNNANRHRHGS